ARSAGPPERRPNCQSLAIALYFGLASRRSGGTGRRARLRGVWGNPWGFESPLRHQSFFPEAIGLPVLKSQRTLPDMGGGVFSPAYTDVTGPGRRRSDTRRPNGLRPRSPRGQEHRGARARRRWLASSCTPPFHPPPVTSTTSSQ